MSEASDERNERWASTTGGHKEGQREVPGQEQQEAASSDLAHVPHTDRSCSHPPGNISRPEPFPPSSTWRSDDPQLRRTRDETEAVDDAGHG